MMYEYQRLELGEMYLAAEKALKSDCPLIEDDVLVATVKHLEALEEFIRSIAVDNIKHSRDELVLQCNSYIGNAKVLVSEMCKDYE